MKQNYPGKILLLLLCLFSISWGAMAQATITGKVTDEKGEALVGANILLKDSNKGTSTNVDGNLPFPFPVLRASWYFLQLVMIAKRLP